MSARPVVWVTRRLPAAVEQALHEHFEIRQREDDAPLDADALAQAFREADAVLCTVTDRISPACLTQPQRRARIVANFGVGVNHIDVASARAAGVTVTNTPDVLTDDTADLAILLMLATLRRAGEGERELRAGRWAGWRPTHLLGTRLTGKTLGIVGLGRIGMAVAQRASAGFGMRVLAWSRSAPRGPEPGVERVATLDALLAQVDVLSLHCPATPDTKHLIAAPQLALMGRHAVLVNTARGDVVDEAALVAALEAGQIAGAGLDVFEREPVVHPGLLRRDDVVLLPHLGSATRETREAMGMRALANLTAFFRGEAVRDRVVS
ncbi:D-glycerate dehydrogenase [Pseudogemmatithrix spongiicola]|uniref:D-glycerate dehydrogenase n=1 Tax=Pseudogemmatithrix spongiicola TaxID=3062599 RepID=A0AA49K066_9BACT|nr:D-glycerate dehydrogenase [Gemmatimonadaceae bacterium 'strain 138']WKW15171.1 D-glycerate dehydrogenase [Gemmatimonadaceae bacterium 'strain 318']